jgi:hypothetical protein
MYTTCSILNVRLQRFTVEGLPLILALIGVGLGQFPRSSGVLR